MLKPTKRKQPPIGNDRETLIVSSHVVPICRQDCCNSENGNKIGFKTHDGNVIDFEYLSDEVQVMMTRDGHGLSYIGHLLGQLEVPFNKVKIRSPRNVSKDFAQWGTIISIGSHLSNQVTARIIDEVLSEIDPNKIQFQFGEYSGHKGDKIICHLKGKEEIFEIFPGNDDIDFAAIVYFQKMYSQECVANFFVLAGLGPQATLGACYYLASSYERLLGKYSSQPFVQIISTRRGETDLQVNLEDGDFISPDSIEKMKIRSKNIIITKRFAVALSFPKKHRSYVGEIASALAVDWDKSRVFFDDFHRGWRGRPSSDTYLQEIYNENTELNVVMLCEEYNESEWCGLEWRGIRDLIKKRQEHKIMLFKVGDGNVEDIIEKTDGLFSIDDVIDTQKYQVEEIVQFINDRLNLLTYPIK